MKNGWLMMRRPFSKGWNSRFVKLNGSILNLSIDENFSEIKERIKIDKRVKISVNSETCFTLIKADGAKYQFSVEQKSDLIDWINALLSADMSNYEIFIDSFDILDVIGEGHFSQVFLAKMAYNDEYIALKVSDTLKTSQNEKNVLSQLNNPFIIDFKFYFEFNDKSYLGLEYVPFGDMYTRLDYEVSKRDVKIYATELILGLEYIHSKGFIIRDLKPENILIGNDGHIKIADFGLAKDLRSKDNSNTLYGTTDYSAPEVLLNQQYGKASDMWSFGIVLYELLYGNSPFYSKNELKTYENIIDGNFEFPEDASEDEIEIISAILKKDPNQRPTFEELKNYPFFKSVSWDCIMEKKYELDFIPDSSNFLKPQNSDLNDLEYGKVSI